MKKDMKRVVKRHYDLTLFAEIVEKLQFALLFKGFSFFAAF